MNDWACKKDQESGLKVLYLSFQLSKLENNLKWMIELIEKDQESRLSALYLSFQLSKLKNIT